MFMKFLKISKQEHELKRYRYRRSSYMTTTVGQRLNHCWQGRDLAQSQDKNSNTTGHWQITVGVIRLELSIVLMRLFHH